MSPDLFYVFAAALVLAGVGISIFGLRKTDFPSSTAVKGILALVAVLVAGTAYFGVELAAEEKAHRFGHENEQSAEESEAAEIENQENEAGGTLPGEGEDESTTSTGE